LILVEPAQAGNLGSAMRVAANFGIRRVELVRPAIDPNDPEVESWACGGDRRIEWRSWPSLQEAATSYHTLAASASGRGRQNLPVMLPHEVVPLLKERGLSGVALVFGNETRGLKREDLDKCDLVITIPTKESFPVLNLTQSIAILTAVISMDANNAPPLREMPATQAEVEQLMEHLRRSLLTIGFLDPQSPQRILRKIRRLFGRAGVTENEVAILRGICRQMEWAAGARPERFQPPEGSGD
jgi:TrmH family RNA methyltransferase